MKDSKKDEIGLALSGGVMVAAAGGAATMRGFQQQHITIGGEERPAMEAFDYVSGLSGGIIPTVLYSYAQNVDTNTLLDAEWREFDPSKITSKVLNRRVKGSVFNQVTTSMILFALPMTFYMCCSCSLHSFVPLVVWFGILRKFGIKRNCFFAQDADAFAKKDVRSSIAPRKDVKIIPLINFIMVGEAEIRGRPRIDAYFDVIQHLNKQGIMNTFTTPEQIEDAIQTVDNGTLIPYIASPTEIIHSYRTESPGNDGPIFKTSSIPTQEWGNRKIRFSLEFLMAMGTNCLGMGGVAEDGDAVGTKVRIAAAQIRKVPFGENGEEKELMFVDGGLIDGLGVPALVQRKVRKIIASIWPHREIRKYEHLYKKTNGKMDLVGWLSETKDLGFCEVASYFGFYHGKHCLYMNHMFEDGRRHLEFLREALDTLYEAGMPLVVTMKDVKVIDNPYWGIEGGETVDLTIIYYTLPKKFSDKIPRETVPPPDSDSPKVDDKGSFTNTEFKDFPNFNGFANFGTTTKTWSFLRTAALSRRQANMSAHLGSWVINEAWEGLSVNGKEVFGGFKEILDPHDV